MLKCLGSIKPVVVKLKKTLVAKNKQKRKSQREVGPMTTSCFIFSCFSYFGFKIEFIQLIEWDKYFMGTVKFNICEY